MVSLKDGPIEGLHPVLLCGLCHGCEEIGGGDTVASKGKAKERRVVLGIL
jgi:hypothetical protein